MNTKLVELDSLRALMAFAVFVSHVQFFAGAEIWAFPLGGVAVTVFVMLSGFAITRSLLGSGASYRQYLARRFWRLYPVYLIGLALGLCTSWMEPGLLAQLGWVHAPSVARIAQRVASENDFFATHLLAHLTMIHGAIPDRALYGSALSFNGAAWSLSLEWQFYLVAPLLLAFTLRSMQGGWPQRVVMIAATLVLLVAGRVGSSALFPQVPSFLPQELGFFFVGILSAIHLERITARRSLLFACAGGLVLVGAAMGSLANILPFAIWAATLVVAAHTAPAVLAPLRRALSTPWLVRAGESSYGFYILHPPILILAAAAVKHSFPGLASHHGFEALLFAAAFAPTCALAWLLFLYVETPINAWAKSRFRASRTIAVATA